ncbi:MAG TPA: sialidase family protein [Gemmatales bacterium]|nr:sialidase family protein [Gemmatales bacterium]
MRCILLVCLLAFALVHGQEQVIPEKDTRQHIVHKVVAITGPETLGPAEVSVAINPVQPDQIRVVSYTLRGTLLGASEDGGITWHNTPFPQPGNTRQQGDDLLAYGPDGTLYHACIRFVGIRTNRPKRAENGIFVHRFRDGEWSTAVPVFDHINTVAPFEDKPWLAIDGTNKPSRGNVYVAWTRFDEYGSKDPEKKSYLYFAHSTNQAQSFHPGIRISDVSGDCLDSGNTLMGGMPAVGPEGQIYVVWSGPEGIMLDRSFDAGLSFGKDILISKHPGGWDQAVDGVMRANGLPILGVDVSSGPHRGSLYVTWGDNRSGDMDIFCAYSRDEGKTWSEPVRVNTDKEKNGRPQFFPWLAVDPVDGSINICFYDRRAETGVKTTLTLARSIDGGQTFTNFAINQPYFECSPQVFFGDYIGLAAQNGKIVVAYSHFTGKTSLALAAGLFHFKPGTNNAAP